MNKVLLRIVAKSGTAIFAEKKSLNNLFPADFS